MATRQGLGGGATEDIGNHILGVDWVEEEPSEDGTRLEGEEREVESLKAGKRLRFQIDHNRLPMRRRFNDLSIWLYLTIDDIHAFPRA